MEAAINGNVKAVDGILNLAYGRKGKLKWELMQVCNFVLQLLMLYLLSNRICWVIQKTQQNLQSFLPFRNPDRLHIHPS